MSTANTELISMGWKSLKGKWGIAIGGFFVYGLIIFALSFYTAFLDVLTGAFTTDSFANTNPVSSIISLIIGGPFALGVAIFSLALVNDSEDLKMEQIFWGFKSFFKSFLTYLLMNIFIILWTLLLVIPGIIAALGYSQTYFLLSEDKDLEPLDALRKSKTMMKGYKGKYFLLSLGLGLITLLGTGLTFGIGLFWLVPFAQTTLAQFYLDLKANYEGAEEAPVAIEE